MNSRSKRFHGWYIVASCFVISLLVGGVIAGVPGVWVSAMGSINERHRFSVAMAAIMIPLTLVPLFIGWLVDRIGCKKPMLVGCLLSGAGVILYAGVSQTWHYALVTLIVVGGSLAATGIPMKALLLRWFRRNRGLAIALAIIGAGVVRERVLTAVSFTGSLGEAGSDWRKPGVVVIGAAALLITIPLILRFIKDRPAEMGLSPDGIKTGETEPIDFDGDSLDEAYRTPAFWCIAGALFLANFLASVPLSFLMTVGNHGRVLVAVGHFLAGFAFLCMPLIGLVADRRGACWTFSAMVSGFAVCVGILLVMPLSLSALSLSLLQRICATGVSVLAPIIIAERHGLYRFGIIFALLTMISQIGAAVGTVIAVLPISFLMDRGINSPMTFRIVMAVLIIFPLLSAYLIRKAVPPADAEPAGIESDQP